MSSGPSQPGSSSGRVLEVPGAPGIRLRNWEAGDEAAFLDLFSDPEVMTYVDDGRVDRERDALTFAKGLTLELGPDQRFAFVMAVLDGETVIGHIELKCTDQTAPDEWEFVYVLARSHWGKGIGSAVARWARDTTQAHDRRLLATVHPDNAASLHVLERVGLDPTSCADDGTLVLREAGGAVLTSRRLFFRFWTVEDIGLARSLWGDADVLRHIDVRETLSQKECMERLSEEQALDENFGVQYWPIFLREDSAFVGCCGLRPRDADEGPAFELGAHLLSAYWAQGLAAEALSAVIQHAFGFLGARQLFAGHHPENARSRTLLKELGFRHTHDEPYGPTGLMHPSYQLDQSDP